MEKLGHVLAKFIEIPMTEIDDDASIQVDLGVDSLDVLKLASEIEKAYKIRIENEEFDRLRSIGGIKKMINEKVAGGVGASK